MQQNAFLGFTQSSRDYQLKRVHRIIRIRLGMMAELKGESKDDTPNGPWLGTLKPLIDAFVAKQHHWVHSEVNVRSIVRTFFTATYDDFYRRTRGYFSPLCLIFSVLDEKGDAVRSARELVKLAGPQGPMVTFSQLIAFSTEEPMRKGSLHEGIDSQMVACTLKEPRYQLQGKAFLPQLWKHVETLASQRDESARMRDLPELSPLFDLLEPLSQHSPISNGGVRGAEALMQKIKKVRATFLPTFPPSYLPPADL